MKNVSIACIEFAQQSFEISFRKLGKCFSIQMYIHSSKSAITC